MNIWLEYFKYNDDRKNNHAQMKEKAKWEPPDPKKIMKRFLLPILMFCLVSLNSLADEVKSKILSNLSETISE